VPVLILHGEKDEVIRSRWQTQLSRRERTEMHHDFSEGNHTDLFDHGAWETTEISLSLNR
jgi:hypothetical protein